MTLEVTSRFFLNKTFLTNQTAGLFCHGLFWWWKVVLLEKRIASQKNGQIGVGETPRFPSPIQVKGDPLKKPEAAAESIESFRYYRQPCLKATACPGGKFQGRYPTVGADFVGSFFCF